MSSVQEILREIEKQGEAFEAYKEANEKRLDALKDGKSGDVKYYDEKMTRIDADLTTFGETKKKFERELEFQRERIEELEATKSNPGKTAVDKIRDEYSETFVDWFRAKGQDSVIESKLADLSRKAMQFKDVTIGSTAGGGFAVPEQIAREIERLEELFSPVRRLVKVVNTSTSDYKELVNIRGTASGWAGESTDRSTPTATSELREVTPTNGELYAYPQVSEWALDDVMFNVENWLADEVAQQFAISEGTAVISGDGTNKPTGMLNTTPVTTADTASPLRAAAAYQYLACDTDAAGSPAVPGILGDCLIDLVYALNSAYRMGATWVMNSTTTGSVRKLKTTDGAYHWQPGLAMGQPDRLLGYPVETWEQMPDVAKNAFPIAFGNFRRGYLLTSRTGLRVLRDQFSNPGYVRFYIRRREGGIVLNNDAIKFIRTVQ